MALLIKCILLLSALGAATAGGINSSQPLLGEYYVGHPAVRRAMREKTTYMPFAQGIHRDTGNTRSEDYQGPLGISPKVDAMNMGPLLNIFWDEQGRVIVANNCRKNTTCISSLNPNTFQIEATYPKPEHSSDLSQLLMVYMQLLNDRITVPTANRHIISLELVGDGEEATFITKRDIDLSSITAPNELILSTTSDSNGNVWFTTGGFAGFGFPAADTATLGYVEPNGKIHINKLPNEVIENSFAVSGPNVYLLTGPAGSADHADASGFFYKMQANDGIKVLAKLPYQAGDGIKKGGVSRGSGSSPSLLGDKYVAFTDNANDQVNLLVYPRARGLNNKTKPLCTVPLFERGLSANENVAVNHWDGKSTYSMILSNFYNSPPPAQLNSPPFGDGTESDPEILNGPFNDLSGMSPGLVRGFRTTITPILSTKTGLLYIPTQDNKLAQNGSYVYYMSAIGFESGKEVWKVRTGAGGTFSNHFLPPVLTSDGGAGQSVVGGFVKVMDGQ